MRSFKTFSALVVTLSMANFAVAGVGLNYGGQGGASGGGNFNFAVSQCSGVGQLTADTMTGGGSAPVGNDRDRLDILSLFQNANGFGGIGGMGGGGGGRRVGSAGDVGSGIGGDTTITISLRDLGGLIGGVVAALGVNTDDVSGSGTPVNSGYCFCMPNDSNDDGVDGSGGDGGDGGDGGNDGGDDGGDNGDGGPSPSVVPEPSTFAVWSLAGALLVSMTRRTEEE